MKSVLALLSHATVLVGYVGATPTWPSSIDELEDLMFLNTGFKKTGFADAVTPCGFSAAGPGRTTAAEWIRSAFHDMATGSVFTGIGGVDASLMFEIDRPENVGAGFSDSLTFFANFYSARVSVADLIALSTYTATRSCGGPIVPLRAGRQDATAAGPSGLTPVPENSQFTFIQQFQRVGFSTAEMIALIACGHSVGGVHATNFPTIVPPGSAPPNNYKSMDSTIDRLDNRIAVEFINGNTTDPMSVGPSIVAGRNSDFKVFTADRNVTMKALLDPVFFASQCAAMFQRMIEVVPSGTFLTDIITPYDVKPSGLQLTLLSGGASISFTGSIRVRTTVRPATNIVSVQLEYKDRIGNVCSSCTITTIVAGTTTGFDDFFTFYSFRSTISSSSGISSFDVIISTSGPTEKYDNNGAGYPIQDAIMLQSTQSCVDGTGKLTAVAAVHVSRSAQPVSLDLSLKVPRQGIVVPALSNSSVSMLQGALVGPYYLYSATFSLDSTQVASTRFDVTSGTGAGSVADTFKSSGDLGSSCGTLGGATSSGSSSSIASSITSSSIITSSSPSSIQPPASSLASPISSSQLFTSITKSSISSTFSIPSLTPSTLSASATPFPTGSTIINSIANYTYYGCRTEATSTRALSAATTCTDFMTLEICSSFCNGYLYWGTEYGRECYCGSTFNVGSSPTQDSDCFYPCPGDKGEYCGAGNRLSVYVLNTKFQSPAPTPVLKSVVGKYNYNGCVTEATIGRALTANTTATDIMTLEYCETWCQGYEYWGVEYGRECYCGDAFNAGSVLTQESDCSFLCPGDNLEYCGAGFRLSSYVLS